MFWTKALRQSHVVLWHWIFLYLAGSIWQWVPDTFANSFGKSTDGAPWLQTCHGKVWANCFFNLSRITLQFEIYGIHTLRKDQHIDSDSICSGDSGLQIRPINYRLVGNVFFPLLCSAEIPKGQIDIGFLDVRQKPHLQHVIGTGYSTYSLLRCTMNGPRFTWGKSHEAKPEPSSENTIAVAILLVGFAKL